MEETRAICRCWLSAIFVQIAVMLVCSNAGQSTQRKNISKVLGVFDHNDTASILQFRSAVRALCPPTIVGDELIFHERMSALEVINATRDVFSGENISYVVYATQHYARFGRLVLDHSINSEIPVVFTMPNKVDGDNQWKHLYGAAKVTDLSDKSTTLSKVNVILNFLSMYGHKDFVTITTTNFDDMHVVSLLGQAASQRNLAMIDWLKIPKNDSVIFNRKIERINSMESSIYAFNLLLITNDISMVNQVITKTANGMQYIWILVTDLDHEVISNTPFHVPMDVILPHRNQTHNNSGYVKDAITMLNDSFNERSHSSSEGCPLMTYKGYNWKFLREPEIYSIFEIYPRSEGSVREKAELSSDGSLSKGEMQRLQKIKFGLVENPPYVIMRRKLSSVKSCKSGSLPCNEITAETKGDDRAWLTRCCDGFVIEVLKMIGEQMNFEPELHIRSDGIAGTQENGSWAGVVDDIIKGNVDMAAALFPNARRSEVLDFTDPYMPSGISLLVKEIERPRNGIYWTAYMRPFHPFLWLAFAVSVGMMIVLLWLVEKFSPVETDKKLFHWQVAFGIDNAVCYVLQLAFGRPADEKKPHTQGAKLAGLVFGIGMMIVIASYSANLAAFLIVTDMTTPVDGIYHERMKNPKPNFKYGTIEGSYMDDFFKNSKKDHFKRMWRFMKDNNVKSLTEGVNKVLSGELSVFIGDTVSLKYAAANDSSCQLKLVGGTFAISGASFAARKGSKELTYISKTLGGLKSKGLTDFINKFWVKRFTCHKPSPSLELEMKDLLGLFLQLLIVIVLCCLGTCCHLTWVYTQGIHRDKHKDIITEEEGADLQGTVEIVDA